MKKCLNERHSPQPRAATSAHFGESIWARPVGSLRVIVIAVAFALMFGANLPAMAQTAATGAVTGNIIDASKGVVPDAKITATNEATGEVRTSRSDSDGNFRIPLLPPGSYRVSVAKDGFKQVTYERIRVNVTETARIDVQLEVGEMKEQFLVTAETALLQTESTALGRVTNRDLVINLPLVTRNYTQITTLSAGVAADVNNANSLGRGDTGESGGNFRAHGAGGRDNNFQMNGVQVNDLQTSGFFSGGVPIPNPDAIEEFKVQTGLYDASYGRNAGANVNVVTKSGGNKFHGTLFEFFRNDALNANAFFRNKAGQKKGLLKQNQFGFTLGGPIPIKKDKLLFFVSYQGIRQINGVGGGTTSNFFSPPFTDDRSAAALGALFSGQRGAFGGVAVAANGSNISPQALAILNRKFPNGKFVIPTPQTIDPTQPLARRGFSAFSVPGRFNENQFIANLDFLHTDKSRFSVKFFWADSNQNQPLPPPNLGGPPAPGFPFLTDNRVRNLSVSHTYIFNSRLINQANFGFYHSGVPTIQQEAFAFSDVGVAAPSNANPFPELAITGSATLGGNGQGLTIEQDHYTFQDSMTYIRGRHTFQFGGGITKSHLNLEDFHFFGGLIFLSWPDFLLGLPAGPIASGGNGTPLSNIIASVDIPGLLDRSWRLTDANAYIQDNYKLNASLTLFLGLRWERIANLGDRLGRNGGFDISRANPNPPAAGTIEGFVVSENFPATVPAGVRQLDNRYGILAENQSNNYAPRVGFAWQLPDTFVPFTKRMVLRGGYGTYYTRATGQPFIQLAAGPPFALLRQLVGVPNAAASFANPFGPELTFPQFPIFSPTTQRSISLVDQHYRPPVTQQFSLNLQTDLGHDFMLETGYVGSRGTHQVLAHSQNQALLASVSSPIRGVTTNTVANVRTRVPILGFTAPGLNDIDTSASSWYHGLEVSLTKRMSKGLQFLAAYTFAHAYNTGGANTGASGFGIAGDQTNLQANYGRSDFNREHRFVLSYVYQLPSLQRFHALVNGLLGGWAVSGVTTFQSGAPLSLVGTNTANVFGITADRAQLAPGCTHEQLTTSGSVHGRLDNFFNNACILRDASGTAIWRVVGNDGVATAFGNSGTGIVFGPDQRNFDIAVIKRTSLSRLREGANVEFRTEFFNAFNTTQFANPTTNVSSSAFGTITATSVNPRIIQFALKLNF